MKQEYNIAKGSATITLSKFSEIDAVYSLEQPSWLKGLVVLIGFLVMGVAIMSSENFYTKEGHVFRI